MLPRGVQQYAQSVGPVLKKLLQPSAYDDAVPVGGSTLNDTVWGRDEDRNRLDPDRDVRVCKLVPCHSEHAVPLGVRP